MLSTAWDAESRTLPLSSCSVEPFGALTVTFERKNVDGQHKAGHDDIRRQGRPAQGRPAQAASLAAVSSSTAYGVVPAKWISTVAAPVCAESPSGSVAFPSVHRRRPAASRSAGCQPCVNAG